MAMDTEHKVARALVDIGAVAFVPDNPITFQSGIVSPVYVDNRTLPFFPKEWKIILESFVDITKNENLNFDIVAGVEAAGIPHSAALGFMLGKPSVFVRKQTKDHGTKKMVEGGNINGKNVLLVEDLVTLGGSSLAAVESIRKEGGIVNDCLVIVKYGFSASEKAFAEAKMRLHTLTSFPIIIDEAKKAGKGTAEEFRKVAEWFRENTK